MNVVLSVVLLVTLGILAPGDSELPVEDTPVFVADCVVYLHGRRLDSALGSGQRGCVFRKTDTAVLVNGVPYVELSDDLHQAAVVTNPSSPRSDPLEESIRQAWKRAGKVSDKQLMGLDGQAMAEGVPVSMKLHGRQEVAVLTLEGDRLLVECEGRQVRIPVRRPESVSKEQYDRKLLSTVFQKMLQQIRAGRIVIAGTGYIHSYPIGEAEAIEKSLRKIPALVHAESVSPAGELVYESITIDGYTWGPEVVSDFMRDAMAEVEK